jgi:hypothetical protein
MTLNIKETQPAGRWNTGNPPKNIICGFVWTGMHSTKGHPAQQPLAALASSIQSCRSDSQAVFTSIESAISTTSPSGVRILEHQNTQKSAATKAMRGKTDDLTHSNDKFCKLLSVMTSLPSCTAHLQAVPNHGHKTNTQSTCVQVCTHPARGITRVMLQTPSLGER